MSKNIFITGTGTDIGKTYVTGLIIKKLKESGKTAYYKAAMSGNFRDNDGRLIPGDAVAVSDFSGIDQPLEEMCPYVYEEAVSPHLAAKLEGNPVDIDVVKKGFKNLCSRYDFVTVEGSGGIICPLRFDEEWLQLEDIIKGLELTSLIVADAGLGTINHLVLTARYMKAQNLHVKGIILNRFLPGNVMHQDNLKMCEALTGLKVLGCVKYGDDQLDISVDLLESLYE